MYRGHIRQPEDAARVLCGAEGVQLLDSFPPASVQPDGAPDDFAWDQDRIAKRFICPRCLELRRQLPEPKPDCSPQACTLHDWDWQCPHS